MSWIRQLFQDKLIKNSIILSVGTGIAQIFPFFVSIFISRVYSPNDIGIYALFYSLCAIFGTFITLGYENIIYLGRTKTAINHGILLCVIITFFMSIILSVVILIVPNSFYFKIGLSGIEPYFQLFFLSFIFSTFSTLFNISFVKEGKFKFLAKAKIFFSITSALIQVIFGLMKIGALGLILANIFAYALADIILLYYLINNGILQLKRIKIKYLKLLFTKYINFSVYMTPSSLISSISNEIPIFLLSRFFGEAIVGFYSFGQKVIILPLSFIITSVQDVFIKEASDEFLKYGNCINVYKKTIKLLVPLFVLALLGFIIFTPFVFNFLFGSKWFISAKIVQVISVFFIVRALSSILSYSLILAGKQKINLFFLIILLVTTVLTFYIGFYLYNDVIKLLVLSTFVNVLCYLFYIKISYKSAINILDK
jgi:O-antigen/teichoic acid export membrane protein